MWVIKTPALLEGGGVGIPEDSYSHSSVARTHDTTYICIQMRLFRLSVIMHRHYCENDLMTFIHSLDGRQ